MPGSCDSGISADPDKITMIMELPTPKSKESSQFMGVAKYLTNFSPKLAQTTSKVQL